MKRLFSKISVVVVSVSLSAACSALLMATPQMAHAGCGTDDCTRPDYPWTATCCRQGALRCEIFNRRVCAASPYGYEYSFIYGNTGECAGADGPSKKAACLAIATDPTPVDPVDPTAL